MSYFSDLWTCSPNKWQFNDAWVSLPIHSFLYNIGRFLSNSFLLSRYFILNLLIWSYFFQHLFPIPLNFTDKIFYFFPFSLRSLIADQPSYISFALSLLSTRQSNLPASHNQTNFHCALLTLSHGSKLHQLSFYLDFFLSLFSCLFGWWPLPLTWGSCIATVSHFTEIMVFWDLYSMLIES